MSRDEAATPPFIVRDRCPGCGGSRGDELFACAFTDPPIRDLLSNFYADQGGIDLDLLHGARYVLDECVDCGLIYQREIASETLLSKLYDEWIGDHERARSLDDRVALAREVEDGLRFFGRPAREVRVFDFGMGWGDFCRMARAFGCTVFGAEIAEARIQRARSEGIVVITWDEIPRHEFEWIRAEQVLEHLPDPLGTVQHLTRSLAPAGIIKLGVPNGGAIKARLSIGDWLAPKKSDRSLNAVAPLEHINCFSHEALVALGRRVGLEPVDIRRAPHVACRGRDRTLRDIGRAVSHRIAPMWRGHRGTSLFFQSPAQCPRRMKSH